MCNVHMQQKALKDNEIIIMHIYICSNVVPSAEWLCIRKRNWCREHFANKSARLGTMLRNILFPVAIFGCSN